MSETMRYRVGGIVFMALAMAGMWLDISEVRIIALMVLCCLCFSTASILHAIQKQER